MIDYQIWKAGRFTTVKPSDPVNTTKNVTSFCVSNGLRNCLFKSQGGWYKLQTDGTLVFIDRALYLISFENLYNILKD
jgi:hypothetical protein